MTLIKQYKGVDLNYCEEDGLIYFNFENQERTTKYIFEAERIINEPIWEDCKLFGYFKDGYIDKEIGLAKAIKKNIKNGKPDWYFKGKYDIEYKKDGINEKTVYPKNNINDLVYKEYLKQKDFYIKELNKLNRIVDKLTN